jgi:pilus assembly protein Flp/PilA
MGNTKTLAIRFVKEESGQNLIEYALIACIIGLAAITSMDYVSTGIKNAFNSISNHLRSQN